MASLAARLVAAATLEGRRAVLAPHGDGDGGGDVSDGAVAEAGCALHGTALGEGTPHAAREAATAALSHVFMLRPAVVAAVWTRERFHAFAARWEVGSDADADPSLWVAALKCVNNGLLQHPPLQTWAMEEGLYVSTLQRAQRVPCLRLLACRFLHRIAATSAPDIHAHLLRHPTFLPTLMALVRHTLADVPAQSTGGGYDGSVAAEEGVKCLYAVLARVDDINHVWPSLAYAGADEAAAGLTPPPVAPMSTVLPSPAPGPPATPITTSSSHNQPAIAAAFSSMARAIMAHALATVAGGAGMEDALPLPALQAPLTVAWVQVCMVAPDLLLAALVPTATGGSDGSAGSPPAPSFLTSVLHHRLRQRGAVDVAETARVAAGGGGASGDGTAPRGDETLAFLAVCAVCARLCHIAPAARLPVVAVLFPPSPPIAGAGTSAVGHASLDAAAEAWGTGMARTCAAYELKACLQSLDDRVKLAVEELVWAACGQDVGQVVQSIGFGLAAGLLHRKGLLSIPGTE